MNKLVTSEEVANQFAKAIQLLLEWARQDMLGTSQPWEDRQITGKERVSRSVLPEAEKLLKAGEVAEILQLSKSKAYNMMTRGEIPTVRMNRSVRVKRSDLEDFIKKNRET